MFAIYRDSLILIFGFAVFIFVILFFVSAPYGKFSRKGWGTAIKSKWAWLIMEFPSPAMMIFFFIISKGKSIPQIIFVIFWLSHYLYRTFLYPFTQSGKEKPYPIVLVIMAIVFNFCNGFVNGYGVFSLQQYTLPWLWSWQFITGVILFSGGFIINKISDEKLRRLREESPEDYVIPNGWLFKYISSPHYFGEIIEWAGWAVMTWSLPGLAFFVFTFANIFPRAITSHKWYKEHFSEYPVDRKAVIPFML
jgi:protein-S-isoprenylcysteine O-methyltransferase Ste14